MPKSAGTINLTVAELDQLRLWATLGITRVEAARRLGRSPSAVIRRVKDLGLDWTSPRRAVAEPKHPWVNLERVHDWGLERETGFEPATPTLAR